MVNNTLLVLVWFEYLSLTKNPKLVNSTIDLMLNVKSYANIQTLHMKLPISDKSTKSQTKRAPFMD